MNKYSCSAVSFWSIDLCNREFEQIKFHACLRCESIDRNRFGLNSTSNSRLWNWTSLLNCFHFHRAGSTMLFVWQHRMHSVIFVVEMWQITLTLWPWLAEKPAWVFRTYAWMTRTPTWTRDVITREASKPPSRLSWQNWSYHINQDHKTSKTAVISLSVSPSRVPHSPEKISVMMRFQMDDIHGIQQ